MRRVKVFSVFLAVLFLSCQGVEYLPLGEVYQEAAKNRDRNPVVMIHGIGGAKLLERATQRVFWGSFMEEGIPLSSEKGMKALALPVWEGNPFPLGDELYACCPLSSFEVEVAGLRFSISIYYKILRTLGIGKYRLVQPDAPVYGKGCSCFSFFYDWRLDNVENARRFGAFLEEKALLIEEMQRERGEFQGPVRFDVVAHSMGGLIARYYLRYGTEDVLDKEEIVVTWKGGKRVARLFLIGTPNLGSLEALRSLIQGESFGPFLERISPVVLATFPSVYQLLPSPQWKVFKDPKGNVVELNLYDASLWKKRGWGVYSPAYRKQALYLMGEEGFRQFPLQALLDRAKKFHRALEVVPHAPCPAKIYLFASNQIPTREAVVVRDEKLDFDHPLVWGKGDGIVPLKSALGDFRHSESESRLVSPIPWSGVYLLRGRHREMVEEENFRNNLLFLLLQTPVKKSKGGL